MLLMNLNAEPVLHAQAKLGEGSIWNERDGVLHWVDIDSCQIHTFDPGSGRDTSILLPAPVGTVVRRSEEYGGGFIAGLPGQFVHVDRSGAVTTLARIEKELSCKKNRMNDGKCDPAGRFWCGSMSNDFEPGAGYLWMMNGDHKIVEKLAGVTISNGIVWTSDKSIMYYIDTATNGVDAFDYNLETAEITNRRQVVRNKWGGHFDGMTIDAEGNLFIAIFGGGRVLKVNPAKGELLGTIHVPGVSKVTSCAFGGPDWQDLYITSAGKNSDPKKEPYAGDLFKITLKDTKGLPAFEFHG